jgi:hypothetical protein
MRLRNWARRFSRRGFLAGGATAVAAVAASGGKVLAEAQANPADKLMPLSAQDKRTLVRFVHDLFPHDRLDDSYYEKAVAATLAEAEKDPSTAKLLKGGIEQLNQLAEADAKRPYLDIAEEDIRVSILRQVEGKSFFYKVYGDAIVGLYNNPDVWPKFGYEGPSSAKGGYLHRGFDDIDWL